MGAHIPPSFPPAPDKLTVETTLRDAAERLGCDADDDRESAPLITRKERVSQAIDDAFLNIIWVGAIPPVPLLSAAFVAYVQTNMVRKICAIHGVPLRTRRALAFGVVGAGGAGAFLTQTAAQSLRFIPAVGALAGTPLQIVVNAASTYAVGRLTHMRLERDGDVGSPRPGRDRAFTRARYQEGLRRARNQLQDIAGKLSAGPNPQRLGPQRLGPHGPGA